MSSLNHLQLRILKLEQYVPEEQRPNITREQWDQICLRAQEKGPLPGFLEGTPEEFSPDSDDLGLNEIRRLALDDLATETKTRSVGIAI